MNKLIGAVFACVLFVHGSSNAATIDQSVLAVDQGFGLAGSLMTAGPTIWRLGAQSVTAGLAGRLTQIDLQLQPGNGTLGLNFSLYDGVINYPGATLLGSLVIPRSSVGQGSDGLTTVDVSAYNYMVTPGQSFSFLISAVSPPSGSNSYSWILGACQNAGCTSFSELDYAGGIHQFRFTNLPTWNIRNERGFRTWVDESAVPEPQSWTLLIAGFGLTGTAMRRRNRAIA
jgi:hypothetical protein